MLIETLKLKPRPLLCGALLVMSLMANAGITLKTGADTKLSEVISSIQTQSDYKFFYDDNIAKSNAKIVTLNDENLDAALKKLFNGTGISYVIKDKVVYLKKNETSRTTNPEKVTHRKISGVILDEDGEPVIGASVIIKGSNVGVSTDTEGHFVLNNVTEGSQCIVSYIGLNSQTFTVSAKEFYSINLSTNSEVLDEVVVVGYGKQSSKLLTTSISSLKIDDVEQGNDYNAIKMLQGRTAGVNVSTPSGKPGAVPNIRVRGIASIAGSASPLYVVDGIPNENMPYLNPNDIERMDVLKDASATAIYGSRANNGVVIITTKSGRTDEKTKINASVRHSIGWIAHDIEMANSAEYARTIQQAVDNYNVQFAGVKPIETFMIPDNIVETNWMDWLQRDAAHSTVANISLTGGSAKTAFFASVGYNGQEGILRKTAFRQVNGRAKFSQTISRIFKFNLNLSGSYTRETLSEEGDGSLKIIRSAREQQPWVGPYDDNGNYTKLTTHLLRHNPVMVLNEESNGNNRLEGMAITNLEITPFKGFKYTPTVSFYGKFSDGKKTLTEKHDARGQTAGWAAVSQQKNTTYRVIIDNIFQYDNEWDRLTYSIMAGHSYEKYAYEQFGAKSDNYKDEAYPSSSFGLINSGTSIYPGTIGYNSYALESILGRIALNWDNRYIFNATIRRDGSSRFPKNKRYGTFPSASLAWRISNEPFFPKDKVVNDLKLRLSWGNTGSMAGISDWAAMSLISSSTSSAYDHASGFSIGNKGGNITWEKSKQYNVGLDAEFFNSRLRFNIDAYYQKTDGLLYAVNQIATSGYSSRTANRGCIDNKGLEFLVAGDIFTGDFKWTLSANASYTRNKLRDLDGNLDMEIRSASGIEGGSYHALIVGKPVSAYYMYRMDGLYQTDAEVPAKLYAKGARAGDVKYFDLNGDGDISGEDRLYVGKATPDVTGGITSTMSWKGFDLSVFCQFSVGGKILAAYRGCGSNEGTEALGLGGGTAFKFESGGQLVSNKQYYNISKYVANNYWHGEGTSNSVPRPVLKNTFTGGYTNYLTSTRYLEDASYFKVKNITLGYSIPKTLLAKVGIDQARVFVTLDNFFTVSDYSGYDPEFSYSSSPSAASYGADFGEQATLKTVVFGASLNF